MSIHLEKMKKKLKSLVAETIEKYNSIVDKGLIKKYFYDSKSSNEGFRHDAMKKMYKTFGKNWSQDAEESSNVFWQEHNTNKERYFKDI